jgi:hypothetical protein
LPLKNFVSTFHGAKAEGRKHQLKTDGYRTKQLIVDAPQNKESATIPHRATLPFLMGDSTYFERKKRHRILPYGYAESAILICDASPRVESFESEAAVRDRPGG